MEQRQPGSQGTNPEPYQAGDPATDGPIRYSLYISGFGLSDSADGPEGAINWDEVEVGKFLHVHVFANVPGGVTSLQGRFRKLTGGGTGDPGADRDLGPGRPRPGGYFRFTLTHYLLEPGTDYLIRVADSFTGDTKAVATHSIRTKR
jgi:hypothetical protein